MPQTPTAQTSRLQHLGCQHTELLRSFGRIAIRFTREHGPVVSLYVARRARNVSRQRIAELIELGRLTVVIVLGQTHLILSEVIAPCHLRKSPTA